MERSELQVQGHGAMVAIYKPYKIILASHNFYHIHMLALGNDSYD